MKRVRWSGACRGMMCVSNGLYIGSEGGGRAKSACDAGRADFTRRRRTATAPGVCHLLQTAQLRASGLCWCWKRSPTNSSPCQVRLPGGRTGRGTQQSAPCLLAILNTWRCLNKSERTSMKSGFTSACGLPRAPSRRQRLLALRLRLGLQRLAQLAAQRGGQRRRHRIPNLPVLVVHGAHKAVLVCGGQGTEGQGVRHWGPWSGSQLLPGGARRIAVACRSRHPPGKPWARAHSRTDTMRSCSGWNTCPTLPMG